MNDLERQREEEEERKSRIDSARDNLYRPGGPSVIHRESDPRLPQEEEALPSQTFAPRVPRTFDEQKFASKATTIFRRMFLGALVFFVIAIGVAGYMYYYGNTTISAKNIEVDIVAPPSVPSSDTFSYDVSIQNGNNGDLLNTALVIDYPEGTRSVEDNTKPLVSERIELGTLSKGAVVRRTLSARFFGEENAQKDVQVRIEYQVPGSNGQFSKDAGFSVFLRLAPVVLTIDALKEINNNQEVTLVAKVVSNSNNTLSNLALNVTYPFGFTYKSSNLEVDGRKGEFPLGELKPNETKTVEIVGDISGQSNEDKVFKFNVGTASNADSTRVSTSLAMHVHDMVIRGDFLATSITFADRKDYVIVGDKLRGTIQWQNTLNVPVNDAKFTLKIDGDLIDKDNIRATQGYYDSNRSLIEWNKNIDPRLEEIKPGEKGEFAFAVDLKGFDEALAERISNPKINLKFDVHARRINENDVTEDIESSFERSVPMVSDVVLTGKTLYSSGPLKNSGPIPPKVETKTTYTVALTLTNTVNEVSNGELTLTLPNYVTYEGEVTPSSERILWNSSTKQLRWSVGSLPVRTGFGTAPRTLNFKVSVLPSRSQIGKTLNLVNNVSFVGRDNFANAEVKASGNIVTTSVQDPGAGFGTGQVVQ